jgi:cyclic pyranopterin phosphate synthase
MLLRVTDVRMIDVGDKPITRRRAVARAEVRMSDEALAKIEEGRVAKGDVLATARVAGIAAAKRTPDLLPLCHPLGLDHVRVDLAVDRAAGCVRVEAECAVEGRTGVEMEALVAVAGAALCVHDMLKSTDPTITIDGIALWEKDGGKSGHWRRPEA